MKKELTEQDDLTPDLIGRVVQFDVYARQACTTDYKNKSQYVGKLLAYKLERDAVIVKLEGLELIQIGSKRQETYIYTMEDAE